MFKRRSRMRRRKRHYHSSNRARKQKQLFVRIGLGVAVVVAALFIIKPTRQAILSFSPTKIWLSIVDPQRNIASQSTPVSQSLTVAVPTNGTILATESGVLVNDVDVIASASAAAAVELAEPLVSLSPKYSVRLSFDSTGTSISASQQIFYKNASENALEQIQLLLPVIPNVVTIRSIIANDANVDGFQIDNINQIATIPLPTPLEAGQEGRLTLVYQVVLPSSPTVPGTNNRTRQIAEFMPLLAPYDGTQWVYTPQAKYGTLADFLITADIPENSDFTVFGSGTSRSLPHDNASITSTEFEFNQVPSFSMAIGSGMRSTSIDSGNTTLNFSFYTTDLLNSWAENCRIGLEYAQTLLGDSPYPLSLFEADITEPIIQSGNIIFINATTLTEQRSTAGFTLMPYFMRIWFARTAQQDPALATLLARYCAERYINQEEFERLTNQSISGDNFSTLDSGATASDLTQATSTDALTTENGMSEGVKTLIALRARFGTTVFDDAVKQYVQSSAEKPFIEYFDEANRNDIDTLLQFALQADASLS